MNALILASGIGKRLMPLTKDIPKCLLRIDGESILGYELKMLSESGIQDIIITTGPHKEKVREFVKQNFPSLNVTYVHNSKYSCTNYIYSMWLTRDVIDNDDDLVLLHGDLVFDKILLDRMIQYKKENCVLVSSGILAVPSKDFKARIIDGVVREIGVNVSGNEAPACMPLYKFSGGDMDKWMERIDKFINDGKVKCYAEDAFNEISEDVLLNPVYYENEFCMEIDDADDLEVAGEFMGIRNKIYKQNSKNVRNSRIQLG